MTAVCQEINCSYSSQEDIETKNSKLIGKRGHVSPKIYMGFGFSAILKCTRLVTIATSILFIRVEKYDSHVSSNKLFIFFQRGHVNKKQQINRQAGSSESKDLYGIWLQYNTQVYKTHHDRYTYSFYKGRKT
jgi:hypothetical protein